MEYNLSEIRNSDKYGVKLKDYEVSKSDTLQYLGPIILNEGKIEEDIIHRLRQDG